MDTENSFTQGERYAAYARATDEKRLLRDYLTSE